MARDKVWLLGIIVLVFGGIYYSYGFYEAITVSLFYPSGGKIVFSVWLAHFAMRFVCLWMPLIIYISKFYADNKAIHIIYCTGCFIAIILGVLGAIVSFHYTKGSVRQEYESITRSSMKNKGRLPSKTLALSSTCCGWESPGDFGAVFDLSSFVSRDLDMMQDIAQCYGQVWSVSQDPKTGNLTYVNGPKSLDNMPQGCRNFYKRLVFRNGNISFFSMLVAVFLGPVFIFVSFKIYKKASRNRVVGESNPLVASENPSKNLSDVTMQ